MPSLSLNVGLNNGRKLPFSGAAPSGIPTATTTIINISVPDLGLDGLFTKVTPGSWSGPGFYTLSFEFGSEWQILDAGDTVVINDLAIQTVNYIPQTSWRDPATTITVVA